MATEDAITIPLNLPRVEAEAFAELLKRTSYDDCVRGANRRKQYPDGRYEQDVMWSGLRLVEFNEAGLCPRTTWSSAPRPESSVVSFTRDKGIPPRTYA